MVVSTNEVEMVGIVVESKLCLVECDDNSDCRQDETDPVHEEELTQYECYETTEGLKYCNDRRNEL